MNFVPSIGDRSGMAFIKSSLIISLTFSFLLCLLINLLFAGIKINAQDLTILYAETFMVTWLFTLTLKILFNLLLRAIKITTAAAVALSAKKNMHSR